MPDLLVYSYRPSLLKYTHLESVEVELVMELVRGLVRGREQVWGQVLEKVQRAGQIREAAVIGLKKLWVELGQVW